MGKEIDVLQQNYVSLRYVVGETVVDAKTIVTPRNVEITRKKNARN